ncbi:MAG: thiosulfate oxidation carrier protein SoxY [Silicimonas sp.]|nr:thiosulfate oxidation carrier protein SoxY [Silicimonas sp.]NND42132.1 thiosulfate oxidation carrier protein SoxY [Silicimonas sp.]
MELTRRQTMIVGLGAVAAAMMPLRAMASVEEYVTEFTGGADTGEGGVTLNAPEIAENGNTVPIEVSAPGAVAIAVFAAGNPVPPVATFNFGPLAASQSASTRIRLAKTQDVIAVAKMADGSFVQTSQTVKVTIGGCGG